MTFEREVRYVVLKITDIQDALTPDEKSALIQIEETVERHREQRGKPPLVCAVVEADWPEYEPIWKAIEQRVLQEQEDNGQFGVGA